jgi:hypothetical protein
MSTLSRYEWTARKSQLRLLRNNIMATLSYRQSTKTAITTRYTVSGIAKVNSALRKAGYDSTDMKQLMHEIGMIVVRAAQPPVLTGRLQSSIRAGRGKTKAVVRAGGARVPYAPVIHYGWADRNIEPQPYLLQALNRKQSDVFRTLEDGIEDILRKHDLI